MELVALEMNEAFNSDSPSCYNNHPNTRREQTNSKTNQGGHIVPTLTHENVGLPCFNKISDSLGAMYMEEADLSDSSEDQQHKDDVEPERDKTNASALPNFRELMAINFDSDKEGSNAETTQLSLSRLFEDIRQEVLTLNGADGETLGLEILFKEPSLSSNASHIKGTRSKAARKRKKQQKRLLNRTCFSSTNKRPGFANTFKELEQSTRYLDDEVDPSISCPVCLEMFFMPTICSPCSHVFCDPCLRALTSQKSENIPCPLCRTVISRCDLDRGLNDHVMDVHAEIYLYRSLQERNSKVRHHQLPFTPPVPIGRRFVRHLIASRANQMDDNWMSHDWFKFLLGCTVGICLSMLIMLLNRVKSINDVREVNILFLSCIFGASVTFIVFKIFKI